MDHGAAGPARAYLKPVGPPRKPPRAARGIVGVSPYRSQGAVMTPSPIDDAGLAVTEIADHLNRLLADVFALYLKTKNFHWHMSGPHFRDYHLMLDEQASQIFAITDDVAERVRKLGGTTLRSIGAIARLQRVRDNDAEDVSPKAMLRELHADNLQLVEAMLDAHAICDDHADVATASLLENWIDEAQRRAWFLAESVR